ncbi:MAG: hypothetical protein M3Q69_13825, partial [Acidobacteriota bacterium]|nr:hypothetical protein [Acidobacteriota bacterium]
TGNTTPGTDRMLVLELDRAVDATIATRLIQIIVQDDDGTGISADEAEVTEAAGAMAKVRVRLDAPSAQPVSVNFRADGQGYASASDYEPASGTLTFAPGETEKFVTVTIRQDAIPEADEVIRLTLSNPVPSTMAIHGSGRITVHDDGDKVSAITFDGDTEAAEGDPAVFGLMSTPRVEKDVRLGVRLVPGTAKPREDYASDFDRYETTAGVRFGATGSSSTFSSAFLVLYTFADSEVEPDETVSVELFNFDDPSHVLGSRTLVIKDTTHLDPVLRVSNTTVVEGSTATFQVSIAQSAAYPISFYVTTVGDTADEGADFTRVANVYNIPKGERRVTVDVKTIGDGLAEGDETFSIRLSQPYNARIDDAIGRATIVDDDTPMPAFTAANVAVRESETTARFVVELATPATQRVTLTYATANGTATSGDDYVAAGGTLVFEAGETTKTIDVTLINDTLTESAETFSLRIGAAAEAVCTITDDDGKSTRKRSVRH